MAQRQITHIMQKGLIWRAILVVLLGSFVLGGCVQNTRRTLPNPRVQPINHNELIFTNGNLNIPTFPTQTISAHPEWLPNPAQEIRDRWLGILIHHTATNQGSADYIDMLHKQRGWDGLGYDFVINNGNGQADGLVEVGWRWPIQREGAHCRVEGDDSNYWNEHTIGIALIGNFEHYPPSPAQYTSLIELVNFLRQRYDISLENIQGHRDIEPTACPGANFDMTRFKQMLRTR